jgi:hypothetical protein
MIKSIGSTNVNMGQFGASTLRPTFLTGIQNGLPVLRFAIANTQSMSSGGQPISGYGGTTSSWFAVMKVTDDGSVSAATLFGYATEGGTTDDATHWAVMSTGGTGANPTVFTTRNNTANLSSVTIIGGTMNQIGTIFNGSTNTMYLGGVAQTPSASTPTFASGAEMFEVGGNFAGNNSNISGDCEIIHCNTALGATDIALLTTYLGRWGV